MQTFGSRIDTCAERMVWKQWFQCRETKDTGTSTTAQHANPSEIARERQAARDKQGTHTRMQASHDQLGPFRSGPKPATFQAGLNARTLAGPHVPKSEREGDPTRRQQRQQLGLRVPGPPVGTERGSHELCVGGTASAQQRARDCKSLPQPQQAAAWWNHNQDESGRSPQKQRVRIVERRRSRNGAHPSETATDLSGPW